jgi:iron complex transport system substrate-binding protein
MKKNRLFSLCLAMALALSPCALAAEPTEAPPSGTVLVEDMKGTAEIPANPQRIVDVSGSADELIILGMPFVASANTSMFDGVTVPAYLQTYFSENGVETVGNYSGGVGDLNLEKIAELKPDLIIMNIRHEKVYEQLKAIAPTVMLTDDINFVNWRGRFQQLGNGLARLTSRASGWTVWPRPRTGPRRSIPSSQRNLCRSRGKLGAFRSYSSICTAGTANWCHEARKLAPFRPAVPQGVLGEVVHAEYFARIDADPTFSFFCATGRSAIRATAWSGRILKAEQNGNVYLGANNLQYDMAYTRNGKQILPGKVRKRHHAPARMSIARASKRQIRRISGASGLEVDANAKRKPPHLLMLNDGCRCFLSVIVLRQPSVRRAEGPDADLRLAQTRAIVGIAAAPCSERMQGNWPPA